MKKLIAVLAVLLITGVVALGQNAKPLSDNQMDTITAGSSGGHDDGGHDGNDGNNGTSNTTVNGAALSGVTTVNLVVSTDSAVASGINVFSGNSNPTSPSSNAPAAPPKNGVGKNSDGHDDGGDDGNHNNSGLNQTNNISIENNSSKASNSSVTISDSAESGITATNLVNAASSAVASGINVAATNSINTTSFSQVNNVSVKH